MFYAYFKILYNTIYSLIANTHKASHPLAKY